MSTSTPQAALLSRMDAYLSGNSCEATAIVKDARAILAKLQATQAEPVQAPPVPPVEVCDWCGKEAIARVCADHKPGQASDKWEGAEEWMPLAWELCADECGEEACTELIWEGGPIPEPWGDRWLKYEDEAKRLIALVRKHIPSVAVQPVQAGGLPDEREAFEQWASDNGEFPRAVARSGDVYHLMATQTYWLAWQARAALSARKPLSNAQSQLEALEDLIEDLSEWSRHVIEDTAPATLEKHVREVLKRHGINGLEVKP